MWRGGGTGRLGGVWGGGVKGEHGEGGSDKGGLEGGEEVGFPDGNGVGGGEVEIGKGGGGGVDGVDKVPDGSGADAAEGGDDPREEEAAPCRGAGCVLGGFFGGAGGDRMAWASRAAAAA